MGILFPTGVVGREFGFEFGAFGLVTTFYFANKYFINIQDELFSFKKTLKLNNILR
jgi:hypothetical protein